jgi:phenylpropionate dioxygenase-like ring-hydroxylating dioxygenase large terminal subunit
MSMLTGAPWLLAHRSMLKPDRPLKVSLYGQDYVLWQDGNGRISGLPNSCPHMGAMLSEGWCVAQSDGSSAIACPFHALEFDGAGCTVMPGTGQKTLAIAQPLDLIIQGDLIWTYGGFEQQLPIPSILSDIAAEFEFIGIAGECSVKTDLLTMLLNMHDYNHQNGTHRPMFEIEEVKIEQFIDQGHYSHIYLTMPRKRPKVADILKNPALLVLPKTLTPNLENFFPSLVLLHAESPIGLFKQCHIFVPESDTHTRTYVLTYGKGNSPIFSLLKNNLLKLVDVIVEQDADILSKLYANSPQKIRLNNEVGMDWVRRNFESFPTIAPPNLSR